MALNANLDNIKVVGPVERFDLNLWKSLLNNGARSYGPRNQCCAEKFEFKQFICGVFLEIKMAFSEVSMTTKVCGYFCVLQFRIKKLPIWSPDDEDIILGI